MNMLLSIQGQEGGGGSNQPDHRMTKKRFKKAYCLFSFGFFC